MPGGIGTYIRGLEKGMGELDPEFDVSVYMSRLPVAVRTALWDWRIGRVRADVVHATSLALPRATRALTVMVHDLAWRHVPDAFTPRGVRWHERGLRRACRTADRLIVPSRVTRDDLVEAGAPPDRVVVIEEGCDHLPPPDHAAARTLIDGDFILTVGTRQPRKNLARVIDAYRRARPELAGEWPLVVVGPKGWGPDEQPSAGVMFAGEVDDEVLAGLYARARALVYVPLVEGFGLPPVEAMHAGAPVVSSTRVPSTAGAAIEVDPTDVDAIAGALLAASIDGPARDDLIRRGHDRARSLTWRATATRHVEVWRELVV